MLGDSLAATHYALEAAAVDEEDRLVMVALSQAYIKSKRLNLAEASLAKLTKSGQALPVDWYNLGLLQVAQSNVSFGAINLLKAGNLSLEAQNYETAYSSLKKLKTLSAKTVT